MSSSRATWLGIGVLGILVVALGVWVLVLQNRLADLQVPERQTGESVEVKDGRKEPGLKPGNLGFHGLSFGEALGKAKGEGKPVMAYFHTATSGPSTGMDATTWKDAAVQNWLRTRVIAVRIDADKEPNLAVANGINALPVMIFFKPDGSEIGRVVGFHTANDFLQEAAKVVK
jgi:hypothetical protein